MEAKKKPFIKRGKDERIAAEGESSVMGKGKERKKMSQRGKVTHRGKKWGRENSKFHAGRGQKGARRE